jgi:hypothetical protein
MIKRLGLAIAAIAIVVAGAATMGLADQPAAAFQQVQNQTPTAPPLCTMPTDRRYSAGAMVDRDGQFYQCVFVFGQNLTPAGVAWVKMEKKIVFTTTEAGK